MVCMFMDFGPGGKDEKERERKNNSIVWTNQHLLPTIRELGPEAPLFGQLIQEEVEVDGTNQMAIT